MRFREAIRNFGQLAGVWALAVAQPLFGLTRSGEAFVLAHWRGGDIVLFAFVVAFAVPAIMVAVEALVGRFRLSLAIGLHVFFVACVVAILALYLIKQRTLWSSGVALVVAALAAVAAGYLYRRFEPVRSFTTLLSPVPVVVIVLFMFTSPVKSLVFPEKASAGLSGTREPTPVVMIVFDEFPELSLLGPDGNLDSKRFPGFAAFARHAIWFRHATTVADHTTAAVPAILTGRHQDWTSTPGLGSHPDNLLALFARRGGVYAEESHTALCPPSACAYNRPRPWPGRMTHTAKALAKLSAATFLPTALYKKLPDEYPLPAEPPPAKRFAMLWQSFLRRDVALHYLHVALPHQPWIWLPSGKRWYGSFNFRDYAPYLPQVQPTGIGLPVNVGGIGGARWTKNPQLVVNMLQRHLAQAQFADRLLSETLAHLRSSGLYDRALVVVTADHGVSFQPGLENRHLSHANSTGIVNVPLFMKLPNQTKGLVSSRHAQTIDIAPTIGAALSMRIPWKVDGTSALAPGPGARRIVVTALASHRHLTFETAGLDRSLLAAARQQSGLFTGDGYDRFFRTGAFSTLVGRRVAGLEVSGTSPLRYGLAGSPHLLDYRPASGFVPALIGGTVTGPHPAGRELAVALNGRVAALTTTHRSGPVVRCEAFAAERFFRPGQNKIAVYEVRAAGGVPELARLQGP